MRNITGLELTIPARRRELGDGVIVNRLLPYAKRRMVGPFIFFDHMGPVRFEAGRGMDVRPHPHIGLATVTYLFRGALMHRDSLGTAKVITPGDVNWMTAGRGIVHSERTPWERRQSGGEMDGIQIWVALPEGAEETEPFFAHHPARDLPEVSPGGVKVRIILGEALGERSPVRLLSRLFYLDVALPSGGTFRFETADQEVAVYPVDGDVSIAGTPLGRGNLGVLPSGTPLEVTTKAPGHLVVFGGDPLGPRHIWWNFVSSSPARIERAKRDWATGAFPTVPGDEAEYIPLPSDSAVASYP